MSTSSNKNNNNNNSSNANNSNSSSANNNSKTNNANDGTNNNNSNNNANDEVNNNTSNIPIEQLLILAMEQINYLSNAVKEEGTRANNAERELDRVEAYYDEEETREATLGEELGYREQEVDYLRRLLDKNGIEYTIGHLG